MFNNKQPICILNIVNELNPVFTTSFDPVVSNSNRDLLGNNVILETNLNPILGTIDDLIIFNHDILDLVIQIYSIVESILKDIVPTDTSTSFLIIDQILCISEVTEFYNERTVRRNTIARSISNCETNNVWLRADSSGNGNDCSSTATINNSRVIARVKRVILFGF